MIITICGSVFFAKEILETKEKLESLGHQVFAPERLDLHLDGMLTEGGKSESAEVKMEHDLIRDHYGKINSSDAILVLNYDKKGIKNYIGGNSFLEIGFAYIMNKKVFLLNNIPEIENYKQEIIAMKPIVIKNILENIK